MRDIALFFALALVPLGAIAQVYQWVDEHGAVQYSNSAPPDGARFRVIGALARGGFLSGPGYALPRDSAPPPPENAEAPRPAPAPEPRGLDFRKYVALYPGMSEGELLGIAGEPDLHTRDRSFSTYTYMPTRIDPYTTTVNLVRGRVSELERVRRF